MVMAEHALHTKVSVKQVQITAKEKPEKTIAAKYNG
jgi:hypothetical protein